MIKEIKYYLKEIVVFLVVTTIFANIISLYKNTDLTIAAFPATFM